jgi:hypothetical protein
MTRNRLWTARVAIFLLVTMSGCKDGAAPTEPAGPPLDLTGAWTGQMAFIGTSETATVSVRQQETQVTAVWSSGRFGTATLSGAMHGSRLLGQVTFQGVFDSCLRVVAVGGDVSASRITLDSHQLCRFDPVGFRLELSR